MSPVALLALAVTLLAVVCGGVGLRIVTALGAGRRDRQILEVLATFGPVIERAQSDPRVLLAWYPTAEAARRTYAEAFAAIEHDSADRFPFGARQVEAAHARWTTDWLEWERDHDTEYRHKSAALDTEIDRSSGAASQTVRTRLEALEQEKLGRYQRRYEEYVRVSRALADLTSGTHQ